MNFAPYRGDCGMSSLVGENGNRHYQNIVVKNIFAHNLSLFKNSFLPKFSELTISHISQQPNNVHIDYHNVNDLLPNIYQVTSESTPQEGGLNGNDLFFSPLRPCFDAQSHNQQPTNIAPESI